MVLNVVYFVVALCASIVGSVSGVGGGVIIKPVFDTLGKMNVTAVSFLSGCTVLVMAFASLVRSKGSKVTLDVKTSIFLALGSALGGVFGKLLFSFAAQKLANDSLLGFIQAAGLFFMHAGVLIYMLNKENVVAFSIKNPLMSVIIGCFLGLISVFLGIGGGTINVGVLYFLYSMYSKEAAFNSLFIILCSQSTGLIQTLVAGTVPIFSMVTLAVMCAGGVAGGILGGKISSTLTNQAVEKTFVGVLLLLLGLNIANMADFAGRL